MMYKQEITLPIELANTHLTLEEIGALFVLMALPHFDTDLKWGEHKQFMGIIQDFVREGIIIPSKVNDDTSVEIDLTWI